MASKVKPNWEPIPDYGDHMTVEECKEAIDSGFFIDYDGHGIYATSDRASDEEFYPSTFDPPSWATHVVWFNR